MSTPLRSPNRWWALVVLSLTQLVVVLDGTIVNIALPQAQIELGLSDSERQWVVTAYALAFGALLLLGGRIADYWGRKRTYLVGMVGFGAASVFGGMAQNGTELIAARGLQGLFAAMLAPAALALLTMTFTHAKNATRRSPSSARSPEQARPSACFSAVHSPSSRTGAGACS